MRFHTLFAASATSAAFIAALSFPLTAKADFTEGNDFENFLSGVVQSPVGIPLEIETPSGGLFQITDQPYNTLVNPLDGLGGVDFLNMTSFGDLIDERSGEKVENIEFFIGGDGDDVLILTTSKQSGLPPNTADATIGGGRGDDIVVMLGDTDDVINTALDDDKVDAGAGDDVVQGADGDDILFGGLGNDLVERGRVQTSSTPGQGMTGSSWRTSPAGRLRSEPDSTSWNSRTRSRFWT